jgi:hypothetical protein
MGIFLIFDLTSVPVTSSILIMKTATEIPASNMKKRFFPGSKPAIAGMQLMFKVVQIAAWLLPESMRSKVGGACCEMGMLLQYNSALSWHDGSNRTRSVYYPRET